MSAADTTDLTEKQRQVLELHNLGKNPTEIAEALGISSQGVHGHFRRLRAKGMMAEAEPIPARTRRPSANGSQVSADDALEAVRSTARRQRAALIARKDEITTEIEALKLEANKIEQTVTALDAMVGSDT